MKALLAILAILPALLIPVYAAEVQFPTLTTDGLTGMDIQTFYPSNSTYTVQIVLQYHVDHPLQIPEIVTWFDIDGSATTIQLQEDFNLIHFPAEEIPEDTSRQDELDRIDQILDEKKLELAEISPALEKVRLCIQEFREEYPIKFAAWERLGTLTEFELTFQQIYSDHPDVAELNANKKHQECEIRKNYIFVGVWEANKGLDGLTDAETTNLEQTMSTPITAKDLRNEIIKAEAFACSEQGKSQGLCKDYLAGEEYLIPKPKLPDWYGSYRNVYQDTPDLQAAIDLAMLTQCEIYYPLYEANASVQLPTWLAHCEDSQ